MSILGSGTGAAADFVAVVVVATVWWQHIAVSYISHIAVLCYISMLLGWAESMVDSEVDCW